MPKQDFTKTEGKGLTSKNGEKTAPLLDPSIRPVFQNAGFDDEVIDGEALAEGHAMGFGLRDCPANDQANGSQPTFGQDIVDAVFQKGEDRRNKD